LPGAAGAKPAGLGSELARHLLGTATLTGIYQR
jgi:hypothetical protein